MSDIYYPLIPDRVLKQDREFNILISDAINAKEARRAKNASGNPRRSFTLLHDHISYSEMIQLRNFFIDRRGRWDSFYFTDPDTEDVYTVRFDIDTLTIDKPLGRSILESPRFSIQVELKEVL